MSWPAAWDITTGSDAVTIAIVDSGADITHPDLVDSIAGGWNLYDHNANYRDLTGHGSKLAGVAAAATIRSPHSLIEARLSSRET